MQQLRSDDTPLKMLRDTDLTVADYRQDIRGRKVLDRDGKTVGHVSALFIDDVERKVRMLDIGGGGFLGIGDEHFLLPVDAITKVDDKDVHVDETADHIKTSPAYDPRLVNSYDRGYWGPYYGHYHRAPYWSDAYDYPMYDDWYGRD